VHEGPQMTPHLVTVPLVTVPLASMGTSAIGWANAARTAAGPTRPMRRAAEKPHPAGGAGRHRKDKER